MKVLRGRPSAPTDRPVTSSTSAGPAAGARSPDRNLHSKFYTFTRSGRSEHVLMVGSANMMLNADIHQWNHLFVTTGRTRIFNQYVALFKDMKHDYRRNQPTYMFCGRAKGTHSNCAPRRTCGQMQSGVAPTPTPLLRSRCVRKGRPRVES